MKSDLLNFNYNVAIEESGIVDSDFIIAGTAINATTTSNNHKFLPEVLEESAKTLIGCPLLVDHENKVENIKGRVFYAGYDSNNQRIPFKAKIMDQTIKSMIKDGRLNSVSVGAMCDPKDIEEDASGAIIPKRIVFKELSLVAVPADQGATFSIAMNQAYKAFKEEKFSDDEIEPEEELEEPVEEQMKKCKECNKMAELNKEGYCKDCMKATKEAQIKSDSSITERRDNMEEQKTQIVEVKVDQSAELIKSMSEKLEAMSKKITELESKKVEEKIVETKEVEEVEEEDSSYKLIQGVGDLRGGSFTMIRNKY